MKQDLNGVRTAKDLEQKYNLGKLTGLKKSIEENIEMIIKTNTSLEKFVVSAVNDLQEQIDGNITTYYYSGVPTLTNLPVSEWEESQYNVHLGDLYYDKDTGYAYRFYFDSDTNIYGWIKLTDSDVTEALALANAASDTADSKKRIFTIEPIPPYDNGDLWIKNMEIYICQISKSKEETFDKNDFIIATKYTDDTYAIGVGNDLQVVNGQVAINTNNIQDTIKKFDDYTPINETLEIQRSVESIQTNTYTKTEINTKLTDGSVTKVLTTSGVFDENGMHYEKTNAPTSTTINEVGVKVDDATGSGNELLFAGYDEDIQQTIVRTDNLTVRKYFVLGEKSRMEDYEDGGGIFVL